MINFANLFPAFILLAIALVVVGTELLKKLDAGNRLKGYRVYLPLLLSAVTAFLLNIGNFFVTEQFWFWWAVIFGFSVFAYEAVLKKISDALGKNG
jgi:hypothetical protein